MGLEYLTWRGKEVEEVEAMLDLLSEVWENPLYQQNIHKNTLKLLYHYF